MLLTKEPTKRLGSGKLDAESIKAHPWFEEINWDDVYNRKLPVTNSFSNKIAKNEKDYISSKLL